MTRAKRISAVPVFIIVLAGWLLTGCDDVESTTELRAEPQSHVTAASDINIIYILTDDQRFDELGFMNPVIDTPNIDKLAQEGVHFKNAFVTTALCSPSRAKRRPTLSSTADIARWYSILYAWTSSELW